MRCFDIGGTTIVAADVMADGQMHHIARVPTPVGSFTDFVGVLETHCPSGDAPISLCVAGVVEPQTGIIISANIPCLSGRCLQQELSAQLARDVYLINDANAFALAESHFGHAKEHKVVLGIILGSGIGGGIVINGQLVNGASGTCGEWGHSTVCLVKSVQPLPDFPCNCGVQHCLDRYGGASGMRNLFKHLDGRTFSNEQIIEAWKANEDAAIKTIDCWLEMVGSALANIVNFLDPSIVVVGGGLSNARELITALDAEVGKRRLAAHTAPLLHVATLGPEQGLLGAALQMINERRL